MSHSPRHPATAVRAALAAPFGPRALGALLHALLGLPLALAGLAVVLAGLLVGGLLSWTAPGLWLTALTVRTALALGSLQRKLAARLLGERDPAPVRESGSGALGWRRALLTERAGWRAVGWTLPAPFAAVPPLVAAVVCYVYGTLLLLHPVLGRWNQLTRHRPDGGTYRVSLEVGGVQFDTWPRWLLPVAVGALLLLLGPWLLRVAHTPHRLLRRALLGPSAADRRIRTLEETRAQAVEDAAATLRRIERDLHDGTQARLVGLGMHLTLIHELIGAGADRAALLAAVETARDNATAAVADLRDLVKGIHPPVLDQGLDTALATLTAGSPLPAALTTDLPRRAAPAIEAIAYFCAAELLANAAKHSGAAHVAVGARIRDGKLELSVRDDGRGGATPGAGSGLRGLLARVRTVDGTLTCDSPPGGPTVVTVELPAG